MSEGQGTSGWTVKVEGMTCGGCARSVKAAIEGAAPGSNATVDLQAGEVRVEGASGVDAIAAAIEDAGFDYAGVVDAAPAAG